MLLGSGIVLAAILVGNWAVALMLVLATPLLPFNLKVIGLGTRAAVHAQLTATRKLSTHLLDQLRGLPTLVGLGAGEEAVRATEEADRELARRTRTVLRVAFLSTAWIELLITVAMAVVATYCGLALLGYLDLPVVPSTMGLGTALFVLVLTPAYFAPARELARGYHARAEAAAAAELISEISDRVPAAPAGGPPTRVPPRAPPGSTGPNGSGKSTLLETLAGRISPAVPRSVLLGGVPVESPPARAISASLTLVEAEDWIADATLAENLRQAAPGADDDTLRAALAAAALEQLPLDTPTGPLGSALSQGQRRRLVIARAVLRTPAVLLLDEPTAGLDDQTAVRMLTGVRHALPNSALVIALPDGHDGLMPFAASRVLRLKSPHVMWSSAT